MIQEQVVNREQWNGALLALPAPHALQTWEWGQVKRRHNWVPTRLLWQQDGQVLAAAQVLRRPVPRTPWGISYAPKGPILDDLDDALVAQVLSSLEHHARKTRSITLKIDPDTNHPQVQQQLLARGWRYSREQIQFRNTGLIDLTLGEQDLLMAMKSKTRYNIRLAGRKGVQVRSGTVAEIPLFYEMYAETGQRDGFLIRPLDYYQDAWQVFLDAGMGHMLLAEVQDEVVAGMILFRFGERAWYMYGASTGKHRNRMPSYALQWEAIRWTKSVGCTTYDLWGAPDELDESDSMWGVWRFKAGLGAVFTPHLGAYDYAPSRLLYWVYSGALPRYVALLRRRHDRNEKGR